MPLRKYVCTMCGNVKRTLKNEVPTCPNSHPEVNVPMTEVITAPTSKMMETTDKFIGKSKIKGLTKILRARSREYARDREADDLIQFNRRNGIEKSGFLKSNGKKRGKIDDK